MNEVALSNNIKQIELEINHYKNIAGQSIWEIGRRLKHVKKQDLAHGQFGEWLKKMNIEHREANRMMKVSEEIPYSTTWSNLGNRALYLIATLPEEEREVEHVTAYGEAKKPDEMTVRELQDLKKQLKQKDDQIKKQQQIINEQADAKPQVVEKVVEVEKEVEHPHIEDMRSDIEQYSVALKKAQSEADAATKRNEFLENQISEMYEERKEVNEKSQRFDELTESIRNLEGQYNRTQEMLVSHKRVLDTIRDGNNLLDTLSGLIYATDIETLVENDLVIRELKKLIDRVEWWLNDMNKKLDSTTILEGEIIYDE